jgi:hypothetical protein
MYTPKYYRDIILICSKHILIILKVVIIMFDETSSVSDYLKRLNEEKNAKQKRIRGKEKRITIILSEYDSRRLKYIANHFSAQTSVFARELLVQALNDSEIITGLSEYGTDTDVYTDEKGEEVWYYKQSDYGRYINSVGDDELPDDDVPDRLPPLKVPPLPPIS